MRAFHVTAPGALELREVEAPRPAPGEVVVEIRTALTCGTDLKLLRRGHPKMPFPTPMGHEFAGTVVEAGEGARFPVGTDLMSVHTAPCGDCFWCGKGQENLCEEAMASMTLGAFADQLLLPRRVVEINAFVKPPSLPWSHAAFLEPLACVVHGAGFVMVEPGDSVAIIGAGPIGLLHLLLAKARGAHVIVIGRHATRLAAARELGADVVIDEQAEGRGGAVAAVHRATDERGADFVIECAATPESWALGVDCVRRGGLVVWFGGCKPGTTVSLDTRRVHYDEIGVVGVFHFTPRDVKEAHRLLAEGIIDVAPLLSGTLPLMDLPLAFERIGRGEGVKYALVP
jgi:L-iditol 2-dehydrogenase